MIERNSKFIFGAVLIFLQQALMALSIYQLGSAGSALTTNNFPILRDKIIAFFLLALAAYIVSACIELIAAQLKATLWRDYICKIIDDVGIEQKFSSVRNRKAIQGWLGSEAPTTIDGAISIYYGLINVYASILFTLFVFHILLGGIITLLMTATILTSYIFVRVVKEKIGRWATEIQQRRLLTVHGIDFLWSNSLNGNSSMRLEAYKVFRTRADDYMQGYSSYTKLEQVVACGPIILAVVSIASYLVFFPVAESAWGVLIAILPRSLQLFGSVHSMSVYTSKFILYRKKINNLTDFFDSLDQQFLDGQIKHQEIFIKNIHTNKFYDSEPFLDQLGELKILSGRFLITGKNGSGKTSYLKRIRYQLPESILLLSDGVLFEGGDMMSTGEQRLNQIKQSLQQNLKALFLDEWDANLDAGHKSAIDKLLSESAKDILIIEVRHNGIPEDQIYQSSVLCS